MSLFPLSKLRRFASKVGALRDTASSHKTRKNRTAQNTMDRIRRHLTIDPLEERHLLSVSPVSPFDSLVNETYSVTNPLYDMAGMPASYTAENLTQTTYSGQSIAVDDDGDFVIVWSRNDEVLDEYGNPIKDSLTGEPMTDQNIYARYFTDEVQRITLPEAIATNNVNGSWGNFSLAIGGNEVQKLTIDASQIPATSSFYASTGNCPGLQGELTITFDANGNGIIDSNEEFQFTYDENDIQGNAEELQRELQRMGGSIGDATVVAINAQEYYIYFGKQSQGLDQPSIEIDSDYTTWLGASADYFPGAYITTVNQPLVIDDLRVNTQDPQATADLIESRFLTTTNTYLNGYVTSGHIAQANGEGGIEDLSNSGPSSTAITTGVEKSRFTDWEIEVRPVENSKTQFDITFTGGASKVNVPELKFVSIENDMDVNLLGTTESIVTLKESSPEFRVNDIEVDDPFTTYPDTTNQTAPAVAMDADGDFIITWQSEVKNGSASNNTSDIYARRFTPTGYTENPEFVTGVQPLGNAFLVNTAQIPGPQTEPAVGMDYDGNFVITWVNANQDLSHHNRVDAQKFNRDGARVGNTFIVVDVVEDSDTDIHFDPYVSLSNDGHVLFTWSETDFVSYVSGNGPIASNVWGKLYSPDGDVISTWDVPMIAAESTSAFDVNNYFIISGTSVSGNDSITGQTASADIYATQYSIAPNDAGINVYRNTYRVNSASFDPNNTPLWSGHQTGSQAMIDADGDVTVTYEGYAPDTSFVLYLDYEYFLDIINDELNNEINSDLAPFLQDLEPVWGTRGFAWVNESAGTNGDIDAEIEYILVSAIANGADDEQVGRLRTILNDKAAIFRGDPNGIMYTSLHATDNANVDFLESDTIVNVERDSTNQRYLIKIPRTIADLQSNGGDFYIRVWRQDYNAYAMSSSEFYDVVGSEDIKITPVFDADGNLLPNKTVDAINEAFESEEYNIFGENSTGTRNNVAVRRIDESYEWLLREGTAWEWTAEEDPVSGQEDYVYEITFQNCAHDTIFSLEYTGVAGQDRLEPTETSRSITIEEYMRAEDGLTQTQASSGMTPDGSFVVAWTQYEEYTNGAYSNTNIYFREYKESCDAAGPRVTDFLLPSGERLDDGDQITSSLQNIVVTFDEELKTSGDGSVLDTTNWSLMKYDENTGNLTEVLGGISEVHFGMNKAADLSTELGLNPLGTNKWEAVLTLDANGTESGITALGNGSYVIAAKSGLKDPSNNPLGSSGYAFNGFDILTSFTVSIPSGDETIVNDELDGVQETLTPPSDDQNNPNEIDTVFPNSPQSIAGDADGEHVVVWTDNGSGASTSAGVYAKIYSLTWNEDSNGERESAAPTIEDIQIQVTDDPTAIYASVARDGDGDFVVTWSAKETDGDWNIWYRTFDSVGNPTSNAEIVNSELDGDQQFSTVAMDNDGDFVITWQSLGQDDSGYGIYAQRFTPNGTNELQTIEFIDTDSTTTTFTLKYNYNGAALETNAIYYDPSQENATDELIQAVQDELDLLGFDTEVYLVRGTTLGVYFKGENAYEDIPLVKAEIKPLDPTFTIDAVASGSTTQTLDITDTYRNTITFTLDFLIQGTTETTESITYTSTDETPLTSVASAIQSELDNLGVDATVSINDDEKIEISYQSTDVLLVNTNVISVLCPTLEIETETQVNGKSLYNKLGGLNEVQTIELKGDIDEVTFSLNFDYDNTDIICGEVSYNANVGDDPLQDLIDQLQAEIDLLSEVDAEVFKFNETTLAIRFIGVSGCTNQPPIMFSTTPEPPAISGAPNASLKLNTLRNGETSEFLVTETTQGNQMWPSVAMDYAGEFIVTWTSYGQDGDTPYESNIYARKFAANEAVIEEVEQLEQNDLGAGTTDTTAISSGMPLGDEFLVNKAYETQVLVVPDDANEDPYYETQSDDEPIEGNQIWSSVAMDADGDFVITWTGYGQDGSGNGYGPGYEGENGVFARRFDKNDGETDVNGSFTTYEVFQVNSFIENEQQHSAVAMDTDGDFVITWESFQEKPVNGSGADAPASYGIYAQRYVSNAKIGTNDAYGVNGEDGGEFHVNTYEAGSQRFPAVTIDDTGDVVIVWNSVTSVDTDGGILLQRFEKTKDEAGPRVTEVEFVAINEGGLITVERITNDSYTDKDIIQLIVTFSEDLNEEFNEYGTNSILNPDNWELSRLMSSGATSTIADVITDVTFSQNAETGKYQAVVSLDYDPTEASVQPLPQGEYVLTIKEEVQDLFGNAIQPNMQNIASDYEFSFAVKDSDLADTPLIPDDDDNGSVNITDGRTYPESPGAVAVDGDGDYVAVWTAYDLDLGADRAYMMRFSAEGVPLWDEPQAITPTDFGTDSQRYVTVACDPDGDFVVTWTNYRDEDGADSNGQEQIDIYAKRYAANGEAQGEAFRVNTYTAGDQIWSNVAMDANGAFVVTWSSLGQENNGAPGYGYGIYARRYDEYGYALDTEFQVNTTTGGDQQFPSIAMAADGTFVIAWQSDQNGVGHDIVARTFNPDGSAKVSPLGGEYVVNDVRVGDQTYPDVAVTLSGESFVVTWTSTQATDDPSGSAVYTKAFDIISDDETNLHYEYGGDPVDVAHGGEAEVRFYVGDGFLIDDLNVTLNIQHNDPSDLIITLIGPDGTEVLLAKNVPLEGDELGVSSGANGANFIDTTFDDAAETSIIDEDVTPPFTGTYSPIGNLSAFNFTNAYGWWTLKVEDADPSDDKDRYTQSSEYYYANFDGGTVMDWSIDFVRLPDISQETLVNTTTTGNQAYSSIDMDYQGNFIVTWTGYGDQENQEDTSDYGVFTQQFAIPAQKVGDETRVNQMTVGRQWISSIGMDAQGSYVTIWSGIGSTSDTSSNVFVRKQNAGSGGDDNEKAIDITGPIVGGVYDGNDKLFEGEVLGGTLDQLVVTFNEDVNHDMNTSGSMEIAPSNSVLNCDNWIIRANGSEILNGVTDVDYGYNPTSGKYEATIYFDGNGLTPGDDGLSAGQYELILRDNVEDLEGNMLDGNYDGETGTDTSVTGLNGYRFTFNISDSDDRFGPEVRANENTEFVQLLSKSNGTGDARETTVRSTAIDDNGDYVVVWTTIGQDDETDPDGKGVYFQLYNADGTKNGTPVRVNNIITGNQQNASVAMDAAGDFVIVWESEQADGTYDIYSQRFNADGSRVANERVDRIDDDPLRGTSGFNQLDAIENLSDRGLDHTDIEVMVNTTQNYNQINPSVAMDSFGNYVVAWGSAGASFSYDNKVCVQSFDFDGEPITDEIQVSVQESSGMAAPGSVAGFTTNTTIAMDDNGRIMVAWDRISVHSNNVVIDTEIVGRLMNLEGEFFTPVFDPTTFLTTASATHGGLIGYTVDSVATTVTSVLLPQMSEGSVVWWQNDDTRTARNPSLSMDSMGNFVIAYEARRDMDNADDDNLFSYGIFYSVYSTETNATTLDDSPPYPLPEEGTLFTSITTFTQTATGQVNTFMPYTVPDDDSDIWSDASIAALSFVGHQVNPSVAMNANGDFAVTWNGPGAEPDPLYPSDPELLTNQDDEGVWIRWFNLSGQAVTTQQRVNMTESGKQNFGSIAMNRDGDCVVAWSGAGVGDRHGVFSREYDVAVDVVGPMATELYHKGENPNVGSGDSYLSVADGDQIYGNPTSLLVVFNEEMDTSEKADNTPDTHSVENVNNWALINGKNEEVSGAISHVDFYFDETLSKWVAEVSFTNSTGLENGTYTLVARTGIDDASGNTLGKTGFRPNGTGMNLGYVDPLTGDVYGLIGNEQLFPYNNPTGGFSFQFGVNNTLPGDLSWGAIDQQVNEEEFGREDESVIARNASGDYVVAWVEYTPIAYFEEVTYVGGSTTNDEEDDESSSSNSSSDDDDDDENTITYYKRYFVYEARIVAQRFDFWGREVGEEIEVNTFELQSTTVDIPIDIAIDDAGNFVVVWSADNTLIEGEDGIFMQRFDYDGDKMGGQIRVNEHRDNAQSDPSVAMAGATGDFVVTWTSFEQDGNQNAVVARLYNLAGTPQGDEFIVNSHTYGTQYDSDVAMDAAGNFVVTWTGEKYNGGAGLEIYARRFNSSGTALGNEFRVNTYTANDQETPAIAMDPQGNFVITWAGYAQSDSSLWDIYARRFNSSGVAQGNDFLVNQTTYQIQIAPDVAMSAENFVITWASFDQDYPYDEYVRDYGIYARMYNANGSDYVDERIGTSPVGEFRVNAVTLGDQTSPAVSMDANGHYVVTWTGPNRPGTADEFITVDDDDDSSSDDDDGFVVDANTYLEQDSTSIYSRLIDPPIVAAASTEPKDVSILGTSGNDVIEFIGGPTTSSWVIKVNGVIYGSIGSNIGTLTIDGGSGNDTLIFTGSSEDDAITLAPGSSSFISNDYNIVANHFESITANGGTGDNVLNIKDSSAKETLTIQPDLVELDGGNITFSVENCATIYASSTSGNDTVEIYDTAGKDFFTSSPTEASMSSEEGSYNVETKGFRYVKSYSTTGEDEANLYDSEGNDLLVTHPAYAKLTGDGFFTIASDFHFISAFASEGNDIARMHDSEGDDVFVAGADYAKFTTDSYYVRADNFDFVQADGSAGGNNSATFYGTDGDDSLIAGNGSGSLLGDNFEIQANGFQTIIAHGREGNDTAILSDSGSDDSLFISSSRTQMQGTVYGVEAHSFENVKALSVNGGNDTASMYDSLSDDLLEAGYDDDDSWVKMSSDGLEYVYELLCFDQVTATSTTQGDQKDTEALDFLIAKGLWEDID